MCGGCRVNPQKRRTCHAWQVVLSMGTLDLVVSWTYVTGDDSRWSDFCPISDRDLPFMLLG